MKFVDSIKRRIPDLFAEIIEEEHKRKAYCASSLTDLHTYRKLRKRRFELINAADKFCQRQKGAPLV